jgi:hypothetical protein
MTPKEVLDIGEPIGDVYNDMTDELLVNIAKHLRSSTTTWTALREIETLERAGQLTKENAAIINRYVQNMPAAIRMAMNESRQIALGEIEDKLAKAASEGYIAKPITDSTVQALRSYEMQAADDLNLVNQTMLNSSQQVYQQAKNELQMKYASIDTDEQLAKAQDILSKQAGSLITGAKTRTDVLRDVIRNLNKEGIDGFYDRRGRAWSPEAYVNMVMRTTTHNAYLASVKSRMQDYNTEVFQVSAHDGARPLCYPYQGKFYSWDGTSGEIELGGGKVVHYDSIYSTSYGEPAGLFGINCGHVPYPMIPGVSVPVDEHIQSPEENEKAYAESQQQRALERDIREAKRNVEMLGNLATDEDKRRVREAQARMREFINETGRARRYDREALYSQRNTDERGVG